MTGAGGTAIRPLSDAEVGTAIDWAAAEGWNPGLDDAALFRAADPQGFLGLFVDGAMAASISVVAYGQDFGFLGLYICRPDLRGRGLGRRLWDAGMARLAGRTVGLDGVVAQQANYARAGFAAAHRNIRYRGIVTAARAADGVALREIDGALADAVVAYDRPHFPAPRPRFLAGWLRPAHGRALAAVAADGAVTGYGVVRACRDGHKIGPLFADSPPIAAAIAAGLVRRCADAPVHLDVPEPNGAGRALAQALGMEPVFETARMYRGPAPSLPLDRIFGITSFELG